MASTYSVTLRDGETATVGIVTSRQQYTAEVGTRGPTAFYIEPTLLGDVSGSFGTKLNFLTAGKYELTATDNLILTNPTTAVSGIQIDLYIKQDATGSRTLSFDTNYVVPPGSVLSSTPGTVDIVTLIVMSSGNIAVRISNGIVLSPPGTTYVASDFVVPNYNNTVTINVANGISYLNNSYIYIYDNSKSPTAVLYGQIISGGGTTSLVVKNLSSTISTYTYTVSAGSVIALTGKFGIDGTNGLRGIGWITGSIDPYQPPQYYNLTLYPSPNFGTIYLNTSTGNYFIWTDDNDGGGYWAGPYSSLKGPTGAKGDTGAQGLPGPAGSIVKGYIYGLTLSNYNSTTGLSVSTGQATDSTGSVIMSLNSAITNKILQASGSWTAGSSNNGLDTGASAASTCYHIYLIAKVDGTTDILFSTSVSSPTLPTGYSYFRRIGSMFSDASKYWIQITQNYNRFILTTPVKVLSGVASNITANTVTLTNVPTGISVKPQLILNGSGTVATIVTDLNGPDITPSTAFTVGPFHVNGATVSATPDVYTSNSAQVRYRSASAGGTVSMWCLGWDDLRGSLG